MTLDDALLELGWPEDVIAAHRAAALPLDEAGDVEIGDDTIVDGATDMFINLKEATLVAEVQFSVFPQFEDNKAAL